jgi:hypothetical protein
LDYVGFRGRYADDFSFKFRTNKIQIRNSECQITEKSRKFYDTVINYVMGFPRK